MLMKPHFSNYFKKIAQELQKEGKKGQKTRIKHQHHASFQKCGFEITGLSYCFIINQKSRLMYQNSSSHYHPFFIFFQPIPTYFPIMKQALGLSFAQFSMQHIQMQQNQSKQNKAFSIPDQEINHVSVAIKSENNFNAISERVFPEENKNIKAQEKLELVRANTKAKMQEISFSDYNQASKTNYKQKKEENEIMIAQKTKEYKKMKKRISKKQKCFKLEEDALNMIRIKKHRRPKPSFLPTAKIIYGMEKLQLLRKLESLRQRRVHNWTTSKFQGIKSRQLTYLFS